MVEDWREEIVTRVVAALSDIASVHAVWLEGSLVSGHADAYADLDLWLDVDAGSGEAAFGAIREALLRLGPLELEHAIDHPDPQIAQRFYRLSGGSPYLFLDVCLQQHGRGTALPPHEPFQVLYDPDGIVCMDTVPADTTELVSRRVGMLQAGWWRRILVLKEVEREKRLEALGYYHALVLEPLTELLRLRYCPEKHDYGLKHITRDLPPEAVERLEALYAVTTLADLPAAVDRADALFTELRRALT